MAGNITAVVFPCLCNVNKVYRCKSEMRILGVDTATKTCGVAVTEGDVLCGMLSLYSHTSHSHQLLSCIHQLLTQLRFSLEDLDGFAITTGPGSFTGLRIGMATLAGLVLGVPRPLIGVNTLEAIGALYFPSSYPICAVLDARKGEVYAAIFSSAQESIVRCTEDMALSPPDLCALITHPTLFVGEGAAVYREFLSTTLGERCLFSCRRLGTSCADMVARLAQESSLTKPESMDSPFALHYIRPSEAELHERRI